MNFKSMVNFFYIIAIKIHVLQKDINFIRVLKNVKENIH